MIAIETDPQADGSRIITRAGDRTCDVVEPPGKGAARLATAERGGDPERDSD